jgi:GT2 family glycosyltransferase
LKERSQLRQASDFAGADVLRDRLREGGWGVIDSPEGSRLEALELPPPPRQVTMLTLVHGWPDDARRWLAGVQAQTSAHDYEALLVDNSGAADVRSWLEGLRAEGAEEGRLRVLRLDPPEGWAQAANRGLEAAAGEVVILFDPGVELTGDVAGPLLGTLADPGVAVAGAFGVRAVGKIGHFHSDPGPEVDALEGYVLAFRRQDALDAGGFDRKYRFYRLADFDLSYRLRDRRGGRAVVLPNLPVSRHQHRLWEALGEQERERLSRRNYYRMIEVWGKRQDLLRK